MTAFENAAVLASPITDDVLQGLSANPKRLPAKLFYDAAGSDLFEEITQTPEYYPTRTERAILEENSAEIIRRAGANLTLVELGAGSAYKTRVLIKAILGRQLRLEFHPVDVSPAALQQAVRSLNGDFPRLHVSPIVADYGQRLPRLNTLPGRKLVLFIGSTIGNFEPEEAQQFLQRVRKSLAPGDALLLGFDLVKDPQVLHQAYNDAAGVTESFNKNMLVRMNRELGADFDLDEFRHVAFWNGRASRIEMHLESRVDQTIRIPALGKSFHFSFGERIHTENSYKFTPASIARLLRQAGLKLEASWSDSSGWFSVVLARV
ncbi:MAG TPA: L-histidine N(alpha)-methyltransferase [Candidatus Limnocylindrales bacterium]|nr:L-histidine N(alpha)-methyltransferase [Candidatus Limnocylindrales bacterium]